MNYKLQYLDDEKIAKEITQQIAATNSSYLSRGDVTVYLKNFPDNTIGSHLYGDYIYSMFANFWSAEYFLNYQSNIWKNIGIEFPGGRIFRSRFPQNEFLNRRPIFIFQYSGKCQSGHCLDNAVLLN